MVKYVEGSFDEDYIQTLGVFRVITVASLIISSHASHPTHRRQLYGEDDLCPPDDYNVFHMGSRRSAPRPSPTLLVTT